MKKIEPRTNHIIVEQQKQDQVGRILIPDDAQKKEDSHWITVAVGADVKDIKPGDELLFDSHCCIKVGIAGIPENYHIVLAANIIGIIKNT